MKTAILLVTDPAPKKLTSAKIDVICRGKLLRTLNGKRTEVGTMLQTAIAWCKDQGIEKTRAEYARR